MNGSSKNMPKLSVIVVNYNTSDHLERCQDSLCGRLQRLPSETIVVDNNSGDNSCAMIREKFPTARLIRNGENLGFAAANNIGISVLFVGGK